LDWLVRVFDRHTKKEAGNRRHLLIVDGHSSHINMAFVKKADELRILLLVLPQHTTHRLQPLDVGLFQLLSTAYSKHLDKFLYNSLGLSKMTKRNFWNIFKSAWDDSFTVKNILHAFEKTGISPFDTTKTLSVIEKKKIPEPAPIQNMTPIACRDVRSVEKDFHYGSPSKS
jgi:hypothetical protein